jgi:hypothetical protein
MKHIRQINSVGTNTYTVIDTTDWMGTIEEHPSVVEHPELFEISEDEIPAEHQYLIYESA